MNKTANYQLTIIVPVYNEEWNILRLEKELGEFLKNAKVTSCVLFVNDGSKDDSERLIRDVCGRNEAFFFLNLARNEYPGRDRPERGHQQDRSDSGG